MGNVMKRSDVPPSQYEQRDVPEALEYFLSITYILGSVLMTVIVGMQGTYTMRDLCNKDAVKKVMKVPTINPWYSAIMWYTMFALLCFTVFQIGSAIMNTSSAFCYTETFISVNAWIAGRFAVYGVYILRLHLMYGNTPFGWSTNTILIALAALHALEFITINIIWANSGDAVWVEAKDPNPPRYCVGILEITSILIVVEEFVITLILAVAFCIPLREILAVEYAKEKSEKVNTKIYKLKSYACRTTILYLSASIMSLVFVLIIAFTGWTALGSLDSIVTAITLCLMTSFYPGWYRKICCLCTSCCDPWHKSLQHERGDADRKYMAAVTFGDFSEVVEMIADYGKTSESELASKDAGNASGNNDTGGDPADADVVQEENEQDAAEQQDTQ